MGDIAVVKGALGTSGRVDVFLTNDSGAVLQRWAPPGGPWYGGAITGSGAHANAVPVVFLDGNTIDLYVEGSSTGTVLECWWDGSWHSQTINP